jgi:hypothetical protein
LTELPDAEQALAAYGAELADGIDAALGPWVVGAVRRISLAWSGDEPPAVAAAALAAGEAARAEVVPALRALLGTDVDEQRTNPLALVRRAVRYPTAVLREAGVPPVERDAQAEAQFPEDDYDLVPARFADLDPALHEPGLRWGAAKAFVIKARRSASPCR